MLHTFIISLVRGAEMRPILKRKECKTMHYDYLFSDDMVGIKKEDEETNLNSQTNANENMFDNEEFTKKLTEATDKVRAEFKEEVDALKSKLLEYESKLSTENKEEVDNENE